MGGIAKTAPPPFIRAGLKKSPEGIFWYHSRTFTVLNRAHRVNLYYLSFLLSKDFRLALWALLSTVKVLTISVNSKQNTTIIQQILNERRQ